MNISTDFPEPTIRHIDDLICVGQCVTTSLLQDNTVSLWRGFGPKIRSIEKRKSNEKISLNSYPANYFDAFNPATEFDKWALVEVNIETPLPEGLEHFIIPKGEYAVFHYRGSSADKGIYQYIYESWLPHSGYKLDARPHFEVLGEKYANNDPTSEEDIWIPISGT